MGCVGKDSAVIPPTATITPSDTPAPDFTLHTLSGDTLTLSDQQGSWVLVNFWATWCAPCVREMPYLQSVADRGDIIVWGINMREPVSDLDTFTDNLDISFPILLSPDDATILAYRGALPRSYIIAPDGSIAETILGPIDEVKFDAWLAENIGQ